MVPSKEWFDTAKQENVYTPDIARVSLSAQHLLFICDEKMHLRSGYSAIAEHTAFLNTVYTKDKFDFYLSRGNEEEGLVKCLVPLKGSLPIRGELHVISTEGLILLDKLWENGVQFRRERIRVTLPYRSVFRRKNRDTRGRPLPSWLENSYTFLSEERTVELRVQMYVGIPEYWADKIDGGYNFEKVTTFVPNNLRSWLDKYYFYVEKRSE